MNRKKITPSHLLRGGGFTRIISTFVFAIFYLCGSILVVPTIYAAGVPGGNVSDPVVGAVDIAKPAMVRIITTLGGRLNVRFTTTSSATFPLSGSSYKMDLLGSGAFISAHGDILTADHVVNPPHDASTDQALYQTAAQDVADYINANFHPSTAWTAQDAFSELSSGALSSQSLYGAPSSKAYLSTDFTGTLDATSLNSMPANTFANVDTIRKESNFENQDTAIVHVNMDDTPSIKLGDSTNVEPQDQLTIIGYPGNGDIVRDNATSLATAVNPSTGFFTASVNKVYVSALKKNNNGAPLIQVGGNVEHGDSGGPALDSNGNVVGVVSFGGTDSPDGTSFLQASSSAQTLIDALQLDTAPGVFQKAWNEAFTQYSSTQAGHWHLAQQQMQKLQTNYPNFHAIDPFLNYANTQANKESTASTNTNIFLLLGALFVLVVIFVLVLVLFMARRKKNRQAALATQPPMYQQPSYNGTGGWPDSTQLSNSGSMPAMDDQDGRDPYAGATPDRNVAQPRPMQPVPQMPQTPMPSYNAAQSGSHPVMPNQPPMSPWPQSFGAPVSGQPVSYGQQPYPEQSTRPVQGAAYQPYPPQQQPYPPYPPAAATPWPPVSGNTPYTPQNSAQQDATILHRQPSPAYGAPYGHPPQGYGAMSAPAQSGPIPAHLIPDASKTSEESTVRVSQGSTSAPEERAEPAEEKKHTASSMSTLDKDQTETATIPGEQDPEK